MPRVFTEADFDNPATSAAPRVFTEADFDDTSAATATVDPVTERPRPAPTDIEPGWSRAERYARYKAEDDARRLAEEEAGRVASMVPPGGVIAPFRGKGLIPPKRPVMQGSDVLPLLKRGLVTGILQPAEQVVSAAAPLRGQPRFAAPASEKEIAQITEGMSEAAKSPQTFGQKLVTTTLESAPSTLPLLFGGGILKGLGAGPKLLKVALAAGEGIQAGQQNALQVAQEIRQAPIDVLKQSAQWAEAYAASPEYLSVPEREQLTREAMALHRGLAVGGITAPVTALFSHLTQAGALGRVLEPNLAQSRLRRLAGAMGSEMLQEMPQSGTEALWTDVGAAPARPGQTPESIAKDVIEQAALGGLSAAAIAAPMGGAAALPRQRLPGLVNPEAVALAQKQGPLPLPLESKVIPLPVSEPAAGGPDPAAVAEIAAHPSLEGYPDDVRVKYAETVLTQGVDAGKAFMDQVDAETAMLASQEEYPARQPMPETELRADPRYRQYRDAGYNDFDAMSFVQQDVKDEQIAGKATGESQEQELIGQAQEQTDMESARRQAALEDQEAARLMPQPSIPSGPEFTDPNDPNLLNHLQEVGDLSPGQIVRMSKAERLRAGNDPAYLQELSTVALAGRRKDTSNATARRKEERREERPRTDVGLVEEGGDRPREEPVQEQGDRDGGRNRPEAGTEVVPKPIPWETGAERPFAFDPNSTENEGRFRLRTPESITKDTYFRRKSSTPGVSYVMGKDATGKEVIQAVRFDKRQMTEAQAADWYAQNAERLGRTPVSKPTKQGERSDEQAEAGSAEAGAAPGGRPRAEAGSAERPAEPATRPERPDAGRPGPSSGTDLAQAGPTERGNVPARPPEAGHPGGQARPAEGGQGAARPASAEVTPPVPSGTARGAVPATAPALTEPAGLAKIKQKQKAKTTTELKGATHDELIESIRNRIRERSVRQRGGRRIESGESRQNILQARATLERIHAKAREGGYGADSEALSEVLGRLLIREPAYTDTALTEYAEDQKRLGYTTVFVSDPLGEMDGLTLGDDKVVFIGKDDAAKHEEFHALRMSGDAAATELLNRVNRESDAFKKYKDELAANLFEQPDERTAEDIAANIYAGDETRFGIPLREALRPSSEPAGLAKIKQAVKSKVNAMKVKAPKPIVTPAPAPTPKPEEPVKTIKTRQTDKGVAMYRRMEPTEKGQVTDEWTKQGSEDHARRVEADLLRWTNALHRVWPDEGMDAERRLEIDAEVSRSAGFERSSERTRRNGYELLAVRNAPQHGLTDPEAKLILVSTENIGRIPYLIEHESFHMLAAEDDPSAVALSNLVDTASPEFKAFGDRMIRERANEVAAVRQLALNVAKGDVTIFLNFQREWWNDEYAARAFGGEETGGFKDNEKAGQLIGAMRNRLEPTEKGQVTDETVQSEDQRQELRDRQTPIWRDVLSRLRNESAGDERSRLSEINLAEGAIQEDDFIEAYQVAKQEGAELIPVSGTRFGGVFVGDAILISTDKGKWGPYIPTLDHELFHKAVHDGKPEALELVRIAAQNDAAIDAYMNRLDSSLEARDWYPEMRVEARKRLGNKATEQDIADDIRTQLAEELVSDLVAGNLEDEGAYVGILPTEEGNRNLWRHNSAFGGRTRRTRVATVPSEVSQGSILNQTDLSYRAQKEQDNRMAGEDMAQGESDTIPLSNPQTDEGSQSGSGSVEGSEEGRTLRGMESRKVGKVARSAETSTETPTQEPKYRRLPPKQFPGISQADLDAINAKIAAMTKLERVKAVAQAKAKLATFRKGPAKAETIRGVVGAAETAGEKEVRDATALLRAALRPQEKTATGKALDRLDTIFAALTEVQADVDAEKTAEAKANVARAGLAAKLFPDSLENRRLLAQYRPARLLKALLDKAEKRIRIAKIHAIRGAMTRYGAMNANERSAAFRNLTNEGRTAMDRWLAMANLMSLADIPTVQPKLLTETSIDANNDVVTSTGAVVGQFDPVLGITLTSPEFVDLDTLYDTLSQIEAETGAVQKAKAEQIVTKAILDADAIITDIKKTGVLPDPDKAAAERLATGQEKKEKATAWRGRATKFRSIFFKFLGPASRAWQLVEALRKGDSQAKGMVAKARAELEGVLKDLGINREVEHAWRTTRRLVKLPGMRIPVGFTNAELIDIYNQLQDPGSRRILLASGAVKGADPLKAEDNRVLFRQIERMVRGDTKLLKVAETMQGIMVKYGQAANQVSQYFRGTDEFVNPFYWPRSVERGSSITDTDDQVNAARSAIQANIKNWGGAKRRIRHGKPLKVRDAFTVFDEHMGDISRYTHLTIPANELLNAMSATVTRKDMPATTAMRQFQVAFGEQYKQYIGGGLRSLMAGDVERLNNSIIRAANKLGRRISGSTLALSASAILQNRYGGMANMAAWLRSRLPRASAEVASDFVRIAALPQGLRGEEAKALLENGYLNDRWSLAALRLALLGWIDDVANSRMMRTFDAWSDKLNRPLVAREMAVAVAAYKALTRNGYSQAEAVDLIEQAVRDTQNTTSELDKSQIAREVQQGFSSWFPFISQGLVQWDFYLDTLAQAKREGWSKTDPRIQSIATAAVLNLFLLSMIINAAMRMFRKDDPIEGPGAAAVEAITQAVEQRLPWLRLFTEGIVGVVNGYSARPINMIERSLSDITAAIGKIVRGKGNYMDAITVTTAAGKAAGIPVGGLSQWLKIVLAQLGIETQGMKTRREDRWFKSEMDEFPDQMSPGALESQSRQMFQKAKTEGLIAPDYKEADFRARVRNRFRGAGGIVIGEKPKRLSDY